MQSLASLKIRKEEKGKKKNLLEASQSMDGMDGEDGRAAIRCPGDPGELAWLFGWQARQAYPNPCP
jgi:hypothetical protein